MSTARTLIIQAVADTIIALALPGIKGVFVRKGERSTAHERYPCIEVSRDEVPDDSNRFGFAFDAPGYPIRVVYLFTDALGPDANLDKIDAWNQAIARTFREPEVLRMAVPTVWNTVIKPLRELDPDDKSYQRVAGGLTIIVSTWEPRGAGA